MLATLCSRGSASDFVLVWCNVGAEIFNVLVCEPVVCEAKSCGPISIKCMDILQVYFEFRYTAYLLPLSGL